MVFMHLFSRSARLSDTAQALFDACEKGRGWEACKQYCTPDAEFKIQAVDALPGPHVTDCKTVEDYTNWMAGVVKNFGDKATYKVLSKAVDKDNCAVTFYAVFMGYSDYVYVFNFDKKTEKVYSFTKIWNDQYAFNNIPGPAPSSGDGKSTTASGEPSVVEGSVEMA